MVDFLVGHRPVTDDDEVSIVFTAKVEIDTTHQGKNYANVGETMHTPFEGERARERAERFMESERTRDFTEADGWRWFIWSTPAANKAYGAAMTRAMLGED